MCRSDGRTLDGSHGAGGGFGGLRQELHEAPDHEVADVDEGWVVGEVVGEDEAGWSTHNHRVHHCTGVGLLK